MTTTTHPDLTPELKLTVVKHLASGKTPDTVATITALPRETVVDIGAHHGYPDTSKLTWAVDIMTKKIDNTAIPKQPPRSIPITTEPPDSPAPPATPSGGGTPLTRPDEIRVLLNTAKSHPSKRIQTAADRVFDAIDRLKTMLREDQEKNAAKRQAEAERAAARAEVERLTRRLAEAKAKLKDSTKVAGGKAAAATGNPIANLRTGLVSTAQLDALGITSKQVRAWALDTGVDCPVSGRLPVRVLDAWKAAHPEAAAS